jgi:hypothetical protein
MAFRFVYQVIFLGTVDARKPIIESRLRDRLGDLGLQNDVVSVLDESTAHTLSNLYPVMGIFLGGQAATNDTALVKQLLDDSIVIAPLVSATKNARNELPPQLQHINALAFSGDESELNRVVSLVLETFRFLRSERRLFISYKRDDAQPFADRIYNELDARNFDAFLDVRSVPPAVDFQSELWHRLSDADVVVLIDTKGFRASRWTTEELARANATNIQILHLLWPGQMEDSSSAFSHFVKLKAADFVFRIPGRGRWVTNATLARICSEAESLRARASAARYRYLVDNFCDAAKDLGMSAYVQSERWIDLETPSGRALAVVPAVGVPTSDRLNTLFNSIGKSVSKPREVWVLYDNRGILPSWLQHLDWLNDHLPVRAVQMAHATDLLKTL